MGATTKNLTRRDAVASLAVLLFTLGLFRLLQLEHNAFNSRIGDFARFGQAIWSVLDGRLLYTHIPGRSILGDHFSPIMVTAAPFLLIWPDERMLLLLQVIFAALSGLVLYWLMRAEHPRYALVVLFAFLLNPELHEFVIGDFRRIGFAFPWLALAVVGIVRKKRWVLALGLFMALLAKESVSLYISAIGVYLLLVERDFRWGLGLLVSGAVCLVVISDVIIPAFSGAEAYPELFYYSHWGATYSEVFLAMLREPLRFLRAVFGPIQLAALFRILLSLGFLVVIDARIALIPLPYVVLMLLSNDPDMMRLQDWYMVTVLPFLFGAIISGWSGLRPKWRTPAAAWLLLASLAGALIFSPTPLGRRFEPGRYVVDEHDRAGNLIAKRVPEEISLLAQTRYTTHLTHVNTIEVYLSENEGEPFSPERIARHDYLLIDRKEPQHPLKLHETELIVQNLLADPGFQIVEEIDGIYFMRRAPAEADWTTHHVFDERMALTGVSVAATDADGFFRTMDLSRLELTPGQTVRVDLFWEALEGEIAERTVSVRLADPEGMLISQKDQIPAEGVRPTSWWVAGQSIRDVHYLHVPEDIPPQGLSLDIVVYDSFTQEVIPDGRNRVAVTLAPVVLQESPAD